MHLKTCSKYIRVKIDISEKRNKQIHNYTWKFPHSGLSSRYKKETEIQQRHKRFKTLWQPGWGNVGGGKEVQEEEDICYTYGWFMLMYGRNQHNIVKQLSSN